MSGPRSFGMSSIFPLEENREEDGAGRRYHTSEQARKYQQRRRVVFYGLQTNPKPEQFQFL